MKISRLCSDVALYFYKSTIWYCMEYCCYVWAVDPNCYLNIFDRLHEWECKTIGPTIAASLVPLTHCQNGARLIVKI